MKKKGGFAMKKKSLGAIALLSLILTGCTTVTPSMIAPEDLYPKALTTCADEPNVPARPAAGKPRSDTDHATYLKNMRDAYLDCHDTVGGWADRRARYVKQYEHQQYGYIERVWRSVTDQAADE